MAAKKGTRPPNAGKGRPKGSLNKTTAGVKAALTAVFEQRGGVNALLTWAKNNETAFYQMWARMLPTEVDVTSNGETLAGLIADAYKNAPPKSE
jgi:hypothetical protein